MTMASSSAALALEKVIGLTTSHNSGLSSHSFSGEVAYAAGCVVVLYHPKKNKQSRYFRAAKPIASISFSHNGKYIAVGERGLKPAVIIWEIKTGSVISELKGHKYGITALAWSSDSTFLVSVGFKSDKQILLWKNKCSIVENLDMKLYAKCSKVVNRVSAVRFSRNDKSFVTCGEKHVTWWKLQPSDSLDVSLPLPPSDQLMPPLPPDKNAEGLSKNDTVFELKGKCASMVESQSGSNFVDIECGVNAKCFALTSQGMLCSFDEELTSLTSFVSLEATNGYCLSLQQPLSDETTGSSVSEDEHAIIAVGCSDGLIRVFDSFDLGYMATLPQPPPAGYLNFKSVDELKKLTMLHQAASESYLRAKSSDGDTVDEDYKPPVLQYPACVALRWLNKSQMSSNPQLKNTAQVPPTHLVAIYGDRSLFVWNISRSSPSQPSQQPSTDELVIGKYRSFQNHSSCIWDIRPMPSTYGPGHGSMFFSCAADNTVRLWSIDSNQALTQTQGETSVSTAQSSNRQANNFFSKELIYSFSCKPITPNSQPASQENGIDQESLKKQLYFEEKYSIPPPSNLGHTVIIDGELDLESSTRVDHISQLGCPRVLAISPNGDEVACGDRSGKLRIWSIDNQEKSTNTATNCNLYDMVFSATAHDAEILCLDYAVQQKSLDSNTGSNEGSKSDSGKVPVILASGGKDGLIHVLGSEGSSNDENLNDSHEKIPYVLLQSLDHHESAVTCLKFSNKGNKLFSIGAEGTLSLSKVNPKELNKSNNGGATAANSLNSLDGSVVSERIHRYRSVPLIHGVSYDVGSDVTGKYIVCAGQTDSKLHIYSSTSGKHLRSYSADPSDGEDGMDTNNNSENIKKGRVKKSVASELYKIDLCPAGMYLVTCSFDRWIRLIDFYSGQVIAQVSGHAELVTSLRFSSDGKRLITSGGDGCVFVWKLNSRITDAMNDRISELKHMQETKTKSQDEPLSQQLQQDNKSNAINSGIDEVSSVSRSEIEAEYLPSPPDVREARLSNHHTFDEGAGDMTPPRHQSPSRETSQESNNPSLVDQESKSPSIKESDIQSREENDHSIDRRVLQGKWAESVEASGGGYNILGKYHVTPPLQGNNVIEHNADDLANVQQTIIQNQNDDDIDENVKTMFSTTTHFKDEESLNEHNERDELTESVEDEDGVILAESPRHTTSGNKQDRPLSFGDSDNSTNDESATECGDTSVSEDDEEEENNYGDNVDTVDEENAIDEEQNLESTWLGDEVRSSWKSVDLEAILSKPAPNNEVAVLANVDSKIEPLSGSTHDPSNGVNVDISETNNENENLALSEDILSFSASFRRSTSSSDMNSSMKRKHSKTKSKKLQSDSGQGDGLFNSPSKRTVTPISNEEQDIIDSVGTVDNDQTSSMVHVPSSAGGGFSTPSKQLRRNPGSLFESQHNGVSSSIASRSSVGSSRTLGEERERLRSRDKRRDTASALQSMNDQLLKMGILKPPLPASEPSSSHQVENNISSEDPTTNGVNGEYISPNESISPLQSLDRQKEENLQSSLATTVSATSEENEEKEENEESEVDTSENNLQKESSSLVDSSSTSVLPRPLSEYRMSLQRLQDAVLETARLYQELQQHHNTGPTDSDMPQATAEMPKQDMVNLNFDTNKVPISFPPNAALSPSRVPRRTSGAEEGSDALGLLGEFAATWESVGGLVAHSQSFASNPAVERSMSSLSSDSIGSFSSFSFNQQPIQESTVASSTDASISVLGLPPILERGESAFDSGLNNNTLKNNTPPSQVSSAEGAHENVSNKGMVSPPSRPAPPPPSASTSPSVGDSNTNISEILSPTFDGQFEEGVSAKKNDNPIGRGSESSNLSFAGMGELGEPSPEVSIILEKYSDVLLGMVQQKLQLSQSQSSILSKNATDESTLSASPEKTEAKP